MSSTPRMISGRWFAIGFGCLLLMGVVIGFLLVLRFQGILTELDHIRQAWPGAAVALESRYQRVDDVLARRNESRVILDDDVLDRWQRSRGEFQSSTQYDVQARAVASLETLIDQLNLKDGKESPLLLNSPSIDEMLQADRTLESLQSDGLGWLCGQLFRMNIPKPIYSFLE